jgi:hypothetical protein
MPQAAGNDAVPSASTQGRGPGSAGAGASPEKSADASKIDDLVDWLLVPRDIQAILDNAQPLRDWMQDVLLKDVEDTVVTHHTLRYVQASLAMHTATDPKVNVKLRTKFWGPPGQPAAPPAHLVRFSETMEYLTNFFMKNGRLRDALNNAVRDSKTVRAGWIKMIWRQDPERTPTGALIHDRQIQAAFRYKYLRDRFKDKQFDDTSAEYTSMMELQAYLRTEIVTQLRKDMTASGVTPIESFTVETQDGLGVHVSTDPRQARMSELLQGKPLTDEEIRDVPRYLGFDFDPVDIEDMRIDWTIDRPEYYRNANRMGFRTRMLREDIVEKFNLTDEQAKQIPETTDEPNFQSMSTNDKHKNQTNGSTTNSSSTYNVGTLDVWEIWDARDRTVYVIMEGVDFFLAKYIPRNTGPGWFPFYYLWFNEIAGYFYAPSMVELLIPLQNEINSVRTHGREYRKATLPRLLIGKDAMSEEEIDKFESSSPLQVIEVQKPDEIQKTLFRFDGIAYNPALVSTQEPMLDMQLMAAMPAAGLGGVGTANLATEVSFAAEQLKSQQGREQFLFVSFIESIAKDMIAIMGRSLPPENAKEIVGPGLVFPNDLNQRESFIAELWLDVTASPTGKPNVAEELKNLQVVSAIMTEHGMQMNPIWLATRLSEINDQNTDWLNAVGAMGPPPGADPAAGGMTGQPSGPAPGTPGGGQTSVPPQPSLPGGQTPR